MIFYIFLNLFIWVYVILGLIRAKAVVYECEVKLNYIFMIFISVFGLFQLLKDINIVTLITFISLVIAGILNYITPSGFCKDGVLIIGRKYPYSKIIKIKPIKEKKQVHILIEMKNKTVFLFQKLEKFDEVKSMVKKYYH